MPAPITNSFAPSPATSQFSSRIQRGFSLVEMAIVLVIVGLLLTGGLTIFTAQQEMQRVQTTTTMLESARESLLGFAAANGRLPCPASATSAGLESFCTNAHPAGCGAAIVVPPGAIQAHGRCSNPWNGFLPAATLGFTPVDGNGYGIDAWNSPNNRIHYAVTDFNTGGINSFTAANQMQTTGTAGGMANLLPDLVVCSNATGITATACGAAPTIILTNNAAAVIYSVGKNAATAVGGTGVDETANPNPNSVNNDRVFVSHERREVGGTNGEFDDIVTWLSPNVLYNRMLAAGRLP